MKADNSKLINTNADIMAKPAVIANNNIDAIGLASLFGVYGYLLASYKVERAGGHGLAQSKRL